MTTRTLVREDGTSRLYEVRDDDGNVIGTDEEFIVTGGPTTQVDDIATALAALPPDTLAALRSALGI